MIPERKETSELSPVITTAFCLEVYFNSGVRKRNPNIAQESCLDEESEFRVSEVARNGRAEFREE